MKYNSSTITLATDSVHERNPFGYSFSYNEKATDKRARALAILLGDYNTYGRDIDVEEFHKIQDKFMDCVREIENLLK